MDIENARNALLEIAGRHGVDIEVPQYGDYVVNVALLGEFSSGKTSLINALLGKKVFPVFSRPTNAVITEIYRSQDGENHFYVQKSEDGKILKREIEPSELAKEISTSERGKKVLAYVASDAIPSNMAIIDTPGVTSLEKLHLETLINYLPNVDVALVVIDSSYGGPTETLVNFLNILPNELLSKVYIILSKIDLLPKGKIENVRSALIEILGDKIPADRIMECSAKWAMEGIERQDEDLINMSGIYGIKKLLTTEIPNYKEEIYRAKMVKELKERAEILKSSLEHKLNALEWNDEELNDQITETMREIKQLQKKLGEFKKRVENIKERTLDEISECIDRHIEIILSIPMQSQSFTEEISQVIANMLDEIQTIMESGVRYLNETTVPGFDGTLEEYIKSVVNKYTESLRNILNLIANIGTFLLTVWIVPGATPGAVDTWEGVAGVLVTLLDRVSPSEKHGPLKTVFHPKKTREETRKRTIRRQKTIKQLAAILREINPIDLGKRFAGRTLLKNHLENKVKPEILLKIESIWDKLEESMEASIREQYLVPISEKREVLQNLMNKRQEKIKSVDAMRNEILEDIRTLEFIIAD